jgi:2,5-diamino-6-(ribosylamino)-4(3H)-pyrimidinone 5'-phosphate reductase
VAVVGQAHTISPRNRQRRYPYVILNAAMSLDGKIATWTGDSRLSSPVDLERVHALRASADGIMVGVRTLLVDNPKLTVKFARGPNPQRIIVDSRARTPPDAQVVKTALQTPTIIAVTSRASRRRVSALEKLGVTILKCGNGPLVSLPILLKELRRRGVKKILLEGGGLLNWSMISQGLVSEVSVAISPRILGGSSAVTLVEGKGVAKTGEGVRLRLLGVRNLGGDTVLRYKVLR